MVAVVPDMQEYKMYKRNSIKYANSSIYRTVMLSGIRYAAMHSIQIKTFMTMGLHKACGSTYALYGACPQT